VCAFYMESNH